MPLPFGVIVSDVHLGDPQGIALEAARGGYIPQGSLHVRRQWGDFVKAIEERIAADAPGKKIPLLVLAGDFWDLAIRNIDEATDLSLRFFASAGLENLFEQILFLPGNHDHYLWSLVQVENSIIRPLDALRGQPPQTTKTVRTLPHVQCAVIDFRKAAPVLDIRGVTSPLHGNIFATGLTGGRIPVNVAYPNLHLIRQGGNVGVVTHGHFFQGAWTLLSDLLRTSIGSTLPGGMDLFYLELMNSSMTDFFNYSLGQVGPLSSVLQRVYDDLRAGRQPPETRKILETLRAMLDEELDFSDDPWLQAKLEELGSDLLLKIVLALVRKGLETAIHGAQSKSALPTARDSMDFLDGPKNLAKIGDFLSFTAKDPILSGLPINELVFGHTHERIAGQNISVGRWKDVRCWNPGSLVASGERCDFMPVEIQESGAVTPFGVFN